MCPQQFLVDARFVVKTIQVRFGDDLDQVLVTGLIFGEQNQMISRIARTAGLFVEARTGGDIGLATDDRFQALFVGRLVKFDRAIHAAMVGDRDRRHVAGVRLIHHIRNTASAVEQAVLGVQMKMDKLGMFHGLVTATLRARRSYRKRRKIKATSNKNETIQISTCRRCGFPTPSLRFQSS